MTCCTSSGFTLFGMVENMLGGGLPPLPPRSFRITTRECPSATCATVWVSDNDGITRHTNEVPYYGKHKQNYNSLPIGAPEEGRLAWACEAAAVELAVDRAVNEGLLHAEERAFVLRHWHAEHPDPWHAEHPEFEARPEGAEWEPAVEETGAVEDTPPFFELYAATAAACAELDRKEAEEAATLEAIKRARILPRTNTAQDVQPVTARSQPRKTVQRKTVRRPVARKARNGAIPVRAGTLYTDLFAVKSR